jgi:hypothetical protein
MPILRTPHPKVEKKPAETWETMTVVAAKIRGVSFMVWTKYLMIW